MDAVSRLYYARNTENKEPQFSDMICANRPSKISVSSVASGLVDRLRLPEERTLAPQRSESSLVGPV